MKGTLLSLVIACILFFIPFFWLKPGFMDLGGDSSRLYFYDPLRYLTHYSLFAVSPSGVGAENIGFMTIPLVSVLVFMKRILVSSTVLISAFHGLSVAAAFWFVYLSVLDIIARIGKNQRYTELAALTSGLLYVFSPISILGWDKVLMTHNHVFLNPVMFYLLLRHLVTGRFFYLFCALLVTVIFSANFSFVAAPVFFAFYPMTLGFLLVYKRRVLGTPIYWRRLLAACIVFILLQAFHIVPQIASMVTPGSVLYASVFSDQGKFDRGLGYFSAIAPSVKASVNIFMLPQVQEVFRLLLFMVLVPVVVVLGFLRSSREGERVQKVLLLTGGCFLVALFFATANITDIGVSMYKKLFILPGFSIYRNYYGQWASSYLFYYTLLFGIALSVVLQAYRKTEILFGIFVFFLIVNAWPFINGALANPVLWQSKDSRIAMNMDPAFVEAIEYLRQLPSDGKVITLPLTDPGYQIVAGKDSGAYQGPSMISYLVGKQDFAGTQEFGRYRELLLSSVRDGDIAMLTRVLGILNIRYVFYNSDTRVYDAFPAFPYQDVRRFFPTRQGEYKQFVESLPLRLLESFDNRFHIYELTTRTTPRIYIPDHTYVISSPASDASVPLSLAAGESSASAFIEGTTTGFGDAHWYLAEAQSTLLRMTKNPSTPRRMHHAFATTPISSMFYPVVMAKEKVTLWKIGKNNYVSHIDQRLLLSAKRVLELEQWGAIMPVVGTMRTLYDVGHFYKEPGLSPHGPRLWDLSAWSRLNSWESVLSRYYTYFDENIRDIEAANESPEWKAQERFLFSEYLRQHYRRLTESIRAQSALSSQREYLESILDMMFGDLLLRARVDLSDLAITYRIQLPKDDAGPFDLYLDSKTLGAQERVTVSVGDKDMQSPEKIEGRWIKLGTVNSSETDPLTQMRLSLIDPKNLFAQSSRLSLESINSSADSVVMTLDASYIKGVRGLVWKIDDWQPQSYYLLTFMYRTNSEPFVARTMEGQMKAGTIIRSATLVDDMLKSQAWAEYQAVIRTDSASDTGLIQIVAANDQSFLSRIELKNMSLVRVQYPFMVLASRGASIEKNGQPSIFFTQRDPTTYNVRISGATRPYVLVLSEAANPRWRVSVIAKPQGSTGSTWRDSAERVVDAVDRVIPIGRRKTIAEARHFEANGYANAWYIEPGDVDDRRDYELELYMTTQSYFYLGAGISLVTLVGLLLYGWRKYRQ